MIEELSKKLIIIRPGAAGDINFIFATWLNGLRYGSDFYGLVDKASYFKNYHEVIKNIIERPTASILVACLTDDNDTIIGYSISEPTILHWVFTKPVWRKLGIGKDLIPPGTKYVTHMTNIGADLLKKKLPNVVLDPFKI